jgi:nicotinate-nucleotide pyrophosphorylase (carboxylating)
VPGDLAQCVAAALAEDVGSGDLTAALVPAQRRGHATVITRESAVIAGRPYVDEVFRQVDARVVVEWGVADGDAVRPEQTLYRLTGPARSLLTGERTALNFLQLLSATATATRRYVDALAGLSCRVLDTRKTLPGLRNAQKYAVRCGGGVNHRHGLYDGILVKENHIVAAGSIGAAVAAAKTAATGVLIEVEVETLDELRQALDAGAEPVDALRVRGLSGDAVTLRVIDAHVNQGTPAGRSMVMISWFSASTRRWSSCRSGDRSR